jgi:putative NADPH-quinone reductase
MMMIATMEGRRNRYIETSFDIFEAVVNLYLRGLLKYCGCRSITSPFALL